MFRRVITSGNLGLLFEKSFRNSRGLGFGTRGNCDNGRIRLSPERYSVRLVISDGM